jgi:hypothetical protein
MNSTPPQTAAPAAEPTGQPAEDVSLTAPGWSTTSPAPMKASSPKTPLPKPLQTPRGIRADGDHPRLSADTGFRSTTALLPDVNI